MGYPYLKGLEADMQIEKISPNLTLQGLFAAWPETISVFIRHHMHCVGCSMSSFDTILDAAENYNLAWDALLAELQDAVDANREISNLF
jgi:hybrid cluster-associated redox disulfide protein